MAPLKRIVREQGLWACHLGPELGGAGYGQLKLGLMNEILGRSRFAPDGIRLPGPRHRQRRNPGAIRHGRAEDAATSQPLLAGEIASSYAMTEPQAGADPAQFTCRATLDGDALGDRRREVVRLARGLRALPAGRRRDRSGGADPRGRFDPDRADRDTPGLEVVRNVAVGCARTSAAACTATCGSATAACRRRSSSASPGQGFDVAQSRLGGGRIHHAMRTVGVLKRALDMMCERALSRRTKGELLSEKQFTQEKIADSYVQITQFRLHVLYAAWLIDKHRAYTREVRREIAAVKSAMPSGAARRGLPRAAPARLARHVERNAAHGALGSSCRRWASSTDRPRCTRSPWRRQCCGTARPRRASGRAISCPTTSQQAREKLAWPRSSGTSGNL